jgi:hypothetical protein
MKKTFLFYLCAVIGLLSINPGVYAQTDVTSTYLSNAGMNGTTGWTMQSNGLASGQPATATTGNAVEFFGSNAGTYAIHLYQTAGNSIPDGIYKVTVNAVNRAGTNPTNMVLFARTADKEDFTMIDSYAYGSLAAGATGLNSGEHLATVDNIKVTGGILTVGIRNIGQCVKVGNGPWTIIANFKLYQYSGAEYATYFNSLITQAQTLAALNYSGVNALNTAISTARTQANEAANLTLEMITTLETAISTYQTSSLSGATSNNPVDATFLIKNAGFENGSDEVKVITANGQLNQPFGWTLTYGATDVNTNAGVISDAIKPAGGSTTVSPTEGSKLFANRLRWTTGSHITIAQSITGLPAGNYKLEVDLGKLDNGSTTNPVFTATAGSSTVFTVTASNAALTTYTSSYFAVGADETFELTCANTQDKQSNSIAILDNIKLTYYGTDATGVLKDVLSGLLATLATYTSSVPSALWTEGSGTLALAQAAGQAQVESSEATEESLNTAITTVTEAIALAASLVTPYADLTTFITACQSVHDNSTATDKTAFATAISTATAAKDAATTLQAVTEARTALETARQTYVLAAQPNDGYSFDYTFKITNPDFEQSSGTNHPGWTNSGNISTFNGANATYTGAPNPNIVADNSNNGSLSQAISDLPAGVYQVKAVARGASGAVMYIEASAGSWQSANTVSIQVNAIGDQGGSLNYGWNPYTTPQILKPANESLYIGERRVSGNWRSTDAYELVYLGDGYKVSFEENSGSDVNDIIVLANGNKKVTKPTDPIRLGYEFGGWFTDDSYDSAFDFDSEISSDITLYAKWESTSPYIIISETSLPAFDYRHTTKQFTVKAVNLNADITFTAPSGISLSPASIPYAAENADNMENAGVVVTATFDRSASITDENIAVTTNDGNTVNITVNADATFRANLMYGWDGYDKTGAGSEPNNYGWQSASGSVNWNVASTANVASFTYYRDGQTLSESKRALSKYTTAADLAYPVSLEAGKSYYFSGKWTWVSDGTSPYGSTFAVYDNAAGNGDAIASVTNTSTKQGTVPSSFGFTAPADAVYWVVWKTTKGRCFAWDLSVVETHDYVIESNATGTVEGYNTVGSSDPSTYSNIIFNEGSQLTGIGEDGLTVRGAVEYQLTVAEKRWYAIGFPFAIASVYSHYFADQGWDADLYPKGYNKTDDYWLRTWNGNQFVANTEGITAETGYIIQFPEWQDDKVISFISEPQITLYNSNANLVSGENYSLVNNPSLQSLPLSTDANNYYRYNPEDNCFNLAETETSINTFEAVITVLKASVPQNASKQILIENDYTGVEKPVLSGADPVVETHYYTLQGAAVRQPAQNGVYIIKNIRQSGREEVSKMIYLKK